MRIIINSTDTSATITSDTRAHEISKLTKNIYVVRTPKGENLLLRNKTLEGAICSLVKMILKNEYE
jgi:hypothetical protein